MKDEEPYQRRRIANEPYKLARGGKRDGSSQLVSITAAVESLLVPNRQARANLPLQCQSIEEGDPLHQTND